MKLRGEEDATVYQFASKVSGHLFCSTCGVPVVNKLGNVEGTPAAMMAGKMPVNARTINGIDLKALRVNRVDGKGLIKPAYEV